jgi:hypothetical protein
VLNDSDIVMDSPSDLKSGVALVRLLETLFHVKIDQTWYDPQPKGESAMVRNCDFVLRFVTAKGVPVSGITGRDILDFDGRPALGLLSLLFFTRPKVPPPLAPVGHLDWLLFWVQSELGRFGREIDNWSTSWARNIPARRIGSPGRS